MELGEPLYEEYTTAPPTGPTRADAKGGRG